MPRHRADRLGLVAALLGLLFTLGACGYSEEQWQALVDKERQMEATCARGSKEELSQPPTPVELSAGCTKDYDCKGDRICREGRCSTP